MAKIYLNQFSLKTKQFRLKQMSEISLQICFPYKMKFLMEFSLFSATVVSVGSHQCDRDQKYFILYLHTPITCRCAQSNEACKEVLHFAELRCIREISIIVAH